MNRTQRKRRKMFRRKYGTATNPFWRNQSAIPFTPEAIARLQQAMREAFDRCTRGL